MLQLLFQPVDPAYPTLMQPYRAMGLILLVNLASVATAFAISRRMTRLKWLPHVLVLAWLPCSLILVRFLALPNLAPDESAGPGDGLIILPVFGEIGAILFGYAAFAAISVFSEIARLVLTLTIRRADGG